MEVTRYMGWRRGNGGYNGCIQTHIDEKAVATMGSETISGIGNVPAQYIVTNIEDSSSIDQASHFCFGSFTFDIDVSNVNDFVHSYDGCCTITLTVDDGSTYSGSFGYTAYVQDVSNSSPQFISPPIWYIMEGCSEQTYHVNPIDPEGDTVRCRWSSASEASAFARNATTLKQFSLDEENCIVTYHPEFDEVGRGSKPIALQVEDFDSNGNLLHSVPLGFVSVVFTPDITAAPNSLTRTSSRKRPLYAGLMEEIEDENDRRRRSSENPDFMLSRNIRSTEPNHCLGRPSFSRQSPAQGEERIFIWKAGLKIIIDWEVSWSIGDSIYYNIPRYQFSSPSGMTCTAFNSDGKAVCTWLPTSQQATQGEHPHCVVAYDYFGRASDRQCITLRVFLPCPEGTQRVGSSCESRLQSCKSGFERNDEGECVDIDECAREMDNCLADKEKCENEEGSYICVDLPMSGEDALATLEQWINMTAEVIDDHPRVGKFRIRIYKLIRNAITSLDANCISPYNQEKYGKNDFAIWIKQATKSDDHCTQTSRLKDGLYSWVDNYACSDTRSRRQTHRIHKFIEKITNPYC
ncbi:Oidioi.mRNA.OKI2018_I69.chr1.g1650.t1.cds [Oikopleura dioica]|uniref:Oidioi.mRNA.OKI2018_I69.chr1.g1650.t1.cds n=1 Tax=Oikopleura dioica TaxID=34765 RepID=A0ABN7STU2_OIKDI|nr:Oidioi.mRNA.OKI2018_I69.chr1.g1650.t1.cds [Oikopleura dioica]